MGDAVMAVFRGEYHLDRAIEAGLGVRARIADLRDNLPNQTNYHPQVSIGINPGEMVSGNIGSTALRRLDYTVIGDTVNTAQRLQATARPGQVVISEICPTANCPNRSPANLLAQPPLKNKAEPVEVYNVVG